jgi:2-polyprenyl-3-methyl-5-hydroxy-6-metoxy-1,4-benzoquinol methylase
MLDIRHEFMLDCFPLYTNPKLIVEVGCGKGEVSRELRKLNHTVITTDIVKYDYLHKEVDDVFRPLNILEEMIQCDISFASEVFEHLSDWKVALKNMIEMTSHFILLTVPYKSSYGSPDHIHRFDANSILEFVKASSPYCCTISKIRTKSRDKIMISPDLPTGQWDYVIQINKKMIVD